ncbi:unnamed protein product [Cylicocyclus nassatus]|uniref:Mos1 transposase HTH domain-containing protein n=1 Tax=Cylicocyclus nassatus TaxID=53992 RepID=A0AA36DP15_CYLNA|nr:unnamed protein product [Cylicocyclus nassatus]
MVSFEKANHGENVVSERQGQKWFKRFREGDESLDDGARRGRPETLSDSVLKEEVEADPSQSTRELAERFGCTHGTVEKHLHALGKSNRCGKWVPHELSGANKEARTRVCRTLLNMSKTSHFYEAILTSDEKWIYFDNQRRKRQWLSRNEQPKPTPKPDAHGKKTMLCVWWNIRGLVYFEVLPPSQPVTADLYAEQLEKVDRALRRQGENPRTIKFLHDNARPHVANIAQQKIEELGWQLLPHPPYSPDLAPSDFHLFRSMQHYLDDKRFETLDDVKICVSQYFDSQPPEFFVKGIRSLREKWRKVIEANGEYLID